MDSDEELTYDTTLDPISPTFDMRKWAPSIRACAASTSYEDYLRRMQEESEQA